MDKGLGVFGWMALGALLSCSTPMAEESTATGGASATNSPQTGVQELTARLNWFRQDSTGTSVYRILVEARDGNGAPVPAAPLAWAMTSPVDSVAGPATVGPDGVAELTWQAFSGPDRVNLLEIRSGPTAVVRLAASADRVLSSSAPADSSVSSADTVGAVLPEGVEVEVLDRNGRPVSGVMLSATVQRASGSIADPRILTDRTGRASAVWHLGVDAGRQSALVKFVRDAGDLRLRDVRSGVIAARGAPLTVEVTALPGNPKKIFLGSSRLTADAVGARFRILASAHDSYGNVVLQPALQLLSKDSAVVRANQDGSLSTTGSGVTQVLVKTGAATDSVLVMVSQRPARLSTTATYSTLGRIGASTAFHYLVTDRLGAPVPSAEPTLTVLTPGNLRLTGPDTVVALTPGVGAIEARYLNLYDTVWVAVTPVPASIVLRGPTDTIQRNEAQAVSVQVFDSGGTVIANPKLLLVSEDPATVALLRPDTLIGGLPGETNIRIRSGPVEVTQVVTVEGVALLADGVPDAGAAAVAAARTLELTNGRVRLRWRRKLTEAGGFEMETRVGSRWFPATVRGAGDWLYVTSSVVTEPTSISIVEETPAGVSVAMRFGAHRFDPVLGRFPANYQNEPFPFTRTLWLRPREYGYFSWTEIERTMVWNGVELEVGFGGVFGPATVRSGQISFRTDTLSGLDRFNVHSVPDAAELNLDGDPLMRVLVPLPEAPMISVLFPGWGFGGVWVHRHDYSSYGAYIYAAPRAVTGSPRQICLDAWAQAPFPLRTLTPAEMAGCGAP